jgi:hypothetical protein
MPESPRWLLAKHRKADAVKILRKMARVNKKKLPDNLIVSLNEDQQKEQVQEQGFIQLLKSRICRIRLGIVIINW